MTLDTILTTVLNNSIDKSNNARIHYLTHLLIVILGGGVFCREEDSGNGDPSGYFHDLGEGEMLVRCPLLETVILGGHLANSKGGIFLKCYSLQTGITFGGRSFLGQSLWMNTENKKSTQTAFGGQSIT